MKLHQSPASPFVRKVLVTLHETGQTGQCELLDTSTTPLADTPDLYPANPLGKIPALERDDGPALYDSRVICRYLDARAGAGLYPKAREWEVLTLEATADAIMEAAIAIVYEGRLRPAEMQFAPWTDAQWQKIARALGAVNTRWMSHLSGPLDISHVAIGCALGYLDFRLNDRGWRRGNDALADWFARFSERDSMKATVPA